MNEDYLSATNDETEIFSSEEYAEVFPDRDDGETSAQFVTPDSNTGTTSDKNKKEISDDEYHRIAAADIQAAQRRLSELPTNDRRGLEDETLYHFGFGFLSNWKHPKNPYAIPTPRFIIPLGDRRNDPPAYNAVMTTSGRERFKNSDRRKAQKCLTAIKKLVFHPSALEAGICAVTEGEMDSASLWQSFHGKLVCDELVDVCALGGTGGASADLIERLKAMEQKPRLVILLFDGDDNHGDNRKPGRERAEELKKELWKIGVVAVCGFFEDILTDEEKKEIGDKPDANEILQRKGNDYLYYIFSRVVKKAIEDAKQASEEMKHWQEYMREQSANNAGDTLTLSTRNNQSNENQNFNDRPEIKELIDEINATITSAMLEEKGYIRHSAKGNPCPNGYECNFCGSGTHKEKTGGLGFTDTAPIIFNCLACGKSGSVFQFLRIVKGKEHARGKEFFSVLKEIADEFGISYDPKIFEYTPPRSLSKRSCPPALRLTEEQKATLFSGDASDDDFAQRLVYMFGDKFRYLQESDEWIIYNRNEHGGGIWKNGGQKNSTLYPFANDLASKLVANAQTKHDDDIAAKLKSTKKKSTAIAALKGVREVIITPEDLDTHNNLLNVLNGVVDLATGKFYPAAPELLLTQQVRACYQQGYQNKTVNGFLKSILPDEETLAGLLRFLGYAATGMCSEEKALFCSGGGGNGKGTLTKTLMHLFGDYAATLKTSAVLLMSKTQDAGAATTELNPLEKCRVAIIEELPQGGRLDVAKFKNLTGGDLIPIRKLHHEQVNIEPHFSPILSGNYLPELSDTRDPGLKRRLLNITFDQTFTGKERDPDLKSKLSTAEALSGLLSLVVAEAVAWYEHGLVISSAMEQATKDYLEENDFIAEFIQENCTRGANLSISRKDFLDRLKNGDYAAECLKQFGNNDRALTSAIRRIEGIEYRRSMQGGGSGGYMFIGIGWNESAKHESLDQGRRLSKKEEPPF